MNIIKLLSKKKIYSILFIICLASFCYIASYNVITIPTDNPPLSDGNYEAMFYIQNEETGTMTCIGDGLINAPSEISNNSEAVANTIITAPDYSNYISNSLSIKWNTITKDDEGFHVIGEIVSSNSTPTTVAQSEFANIEEMKSANLSIGDIVTTRGFYFENDGGGAEYKISNSTNNLPILNIYVPLNNGLYANLVYTDSINVKQIGAKGDSVSNDSIFFNSVLDCGIPLSVPSGIYEMDNTDLSSDSFISINGVGESQPTLRNTTIIAPYGLSLSNLILDGGNKHSLFLEGRSKNEGTFLCIVSPITKTTVSYNNCIFTNADFGSFAMVSPQKTSQYFESDRVSNCIFSNLRLIGVYHCLNSDLTEYNNNTFENIGDSNLTTGTIGALKIGDTTNITTMGAKKCIISNNDFKSLYSGDDYSNTKHAINCNVITVYGDNALITSNNIYDLLGYGEDREAIYTKVRQCTISYNKIYNGGFGEGYICNKGFDSSDAFCTITNNILIGKYGSAIQNYGAAIIKDNDIQINHPRSIIGCFGRKTNLNDLTIESNKITAYPEYYEINNKQISSYKPTYIIHTEEYPNQVTIKDNIISLDSKNNIPMNAVLRVGSLKDNYTISGNTINSNLTKCVGIEISARQEFEQYNKEGEFIISKNDINTNDKPISITIQGTISNTDREFKIQDNEITCNKQMGYPISITDSTNNNDTLLFNNNDLDLNFTKKELYSNVKSVKQ